MPRSATRPPGAETLGEHSPPGGTASGGDLAGPAARQVVASAPGKLILMGEHAVVYGRPALVAALDLRLLVFVTRRADRQVVIELPGAGRRATTWPEIADYARRARDSWQRWYDAPDATPFRDVCGGGFEHVVLVALGEAAAFAGGEAAGPRGESAGPRGAAAGGAGEAAVVAGDEVPFGADGSGIELRIATHLPVGRGFGSSAATAAGTVAALLRLRGAAFSRTDLQRLAVEVERRQHGLPSGVDPATVLHGGVLWAEPRRSAGGQAERLVVSPLAGRSPLLAHLAVFDTGQPPEPTGEVVAAVRQLHRRDPARVAGLCDEIEAATRELRALVAEPAAPVPAALPLLRRAQRALEGLGVVPEPVRRLVREIEAAGGAAKISGAGSLAGPGAGCLIALHQDPARLDAVAAAAAAERLPVLLGGPGLTLEAS